MRAKHFTPSRMLPEDTDSFRSRRLGTVTRGDGTSTRHDIHNRLYDPKHPVPTITSGYTFGGNKGTQWIMDNLGPRQWTLDEECDLHNLDSTAKAYLHTRKYADALGYIARSFPVAPLVEMYAEFERCLRSDERKDFLVLPVVSLPTQYTTLGMQVHATMPPLEEVRRQQLLDPDIRPLFKYHEEDKGEAFLEQSKTKY